MAFILAKEMVVRQKPWTQKNYWPLSKLGIHERKIRGKKCVLKTHAFEEFVSFIKKW